MVGTALEIYYKNLSGDTIKKMLTDFTKEYKKNLVEPEGLYLNRIEY